MDVVSSLLVGVALLFFGVALPTARQKSWLDAEVVTSLIFGGLSAFAALIWESILEDMVDERLVASLRNIANSGSVWLGIVLLLWLYVAARSIISDRERRVMANVIRNDILPFRAALMRWVLPRRLTPSQRSALTKHLKGAPPYKAEFVVDRYDEEASQYVGDIQGALIDADWITKRNYAESRMESGVRIRFHTTMETQEKYSNSPELNPMRILQDAFQRVDIRIQGAGGGTSKDAKEDSLSISVGPRRRDAHGDIQAWPDDLGTFRG